MKERDDAQKEVAGLFAELEALKDHNVQLVDRAANYQVQAKAKEVSMRGRGKGGRADGVGKGKGLWEAEGLVGCGKCGGREREGLIKPHDRRGRLDWK